jgi:hypothetical protein
MGVPPGSSVKNLRKYSTGVYTPFSEFQREFIGWDENFILI